jgi:hypothetical protein
MTQALYAHTNNKRKKNFLGDSFDSPRKKKLGKAFYFILWIPSLTQ